MRRSSQVLAPLLASTAVALLAGCRHYEQQACVDEQNHVVDPKFCKDLPPNAGTPIAGSPATGGGYYNNNIWVPHIYRFYYGGGSTGFGGIVNGGSYVPSSGHNYSFTGTTRGGFGSSFSGSEGEGGGHAGSGE